MDCFDIGLKLLSLKVRQTAGDQVPELTPEEKDFAKSCFGSCAPSVEDLHDKLSLLDESDTDKVANFASLMRMVEIANKISDHRWRNR